MDWIYFYISCLWPKRFIEISMKSGSGIEVRGDQIRKFSDVSACGSLESKDTTYNGHEFKQASIYVSTVYNS